VRCAGDAEVARQHAPRVAVEDGETRVAGQRQDRPGGRAADARQLRHRLEAQRELAAVLGADEVCGAVQVAGARVVAEARPQVQHLVDRRSGQRVHVGEACHEALVVRDDGLDLGLLQHDLGDPHAVWRALQLPGQVVAPRAGVPVEKRGCDRG